MDMFSQNNDQKHIENIAALLTEAENVLFITGAGISAESGLPTYRGVGGLYNDRLTEDGIPIETALAGETLQKNPECTWKYLAQLEERSRGASFNQAHKIIADIEAAKQRVWVLTQNIDGFHTKAGSKNVIEVHGNIHKLVCSYCGLRLQIQDFTEIDIPPRCTECRQIMRPDVVFFGEMLPLEQVTTLLSQVEQGFDMYFSIGTTSVFPYIRQPMEDAKRRGRPTVEINPGQTEISRWVDYKIPSGAVDGLSRIWGRVQQGRSL